MLSVVGVNLPTRPGAAPSGATAANLCVLACDSAEERPGEYLSAHRNSALDGGAAAIGNVGRDLESCIKVGRRKQEGRICQFENAKTTTRSDNTVSLHWLG